MLILAALFSLQVHAADKAAKPVKKEAPPQGSLSKPLELPKPVEGYPPPAKGTVSVKKCKPVNANERAVRLANQNSREANAELESPVSECAPGEVPSDEVEYKFGK